MVAEKLYCYKRLLTITICLSTPFLAAGSITAASPLPGRRSIASHRHVHGRAERSKAEAKLKPGLRGAPKSEAQAQSDPRIKLHVEG